MAARGIVEEPVLGVGDEQSSEGMEQAHEEKGEILESHEADEEETDPKVTLPTPTMPSRLEVEDHRVDHLPYRAWCEYCNEGRGREFAHAKVTSDRQIPIICFDYMFITRHGVYMRGECCPAPSEKAAYSKCWW